MTMTKFNLYRFITTFCLVPTTDWGAFIQRIVMRVMAVRLFLFLFDLLKAPLFIGSLIALLTFSPDTLAWIFIKIGEIQMSIMMTLLMIVMPSLFEGITDGGWFDVWQKGLSVLPEDVVAILNGLGVSQLIGMTLFALGMGHTVKLYRRVMLRAHLI